MRSAFPKVLHEVGGLPMVCHAVRAASEAGGDAHAVVVGREASKVEAAVRKVALNATFHEQVERLGTGHAVLAAREAIARGYDDLLVLFADTPLVRSSTLAIMRELLARGADVAVLGFRTPNPSGYGRLVMENGQIAAIREDKDASEAERAIDFCNGGIMAINGRKALELLGAIGNANAKGEYYLTDVVAIARTGGLKVVAHEAPEEEILGVNTRVELARVENIWQERRRTGLMLSGVTMIAPHTVHLSHDTVVGPDTLIEPNVFFGPGVTIGSGVTVHAFTHLVDTTLADGCHVGPFARMRGNARVGEGAHVGNFVEFKNVEFGKGAKASHLTYLGDASVGAKANVGAGTITCNYDGVNKHRTQIGAGAFIGSNSSLVAPVSIGEGAYVASGSVIVEDVPAEAMAIARGRQATKPGHARTIKARAEAAKAAKTAKPR
jgi:bifunctional UDP-N-acetylglucosamine pyrophosphorylase/glucosamine-1-phosphate N-acetyltransferase